MKTFIPMLIVDLRLFDTQTTLTPGLSAENKTFYDKTLIKEAGPNLVHAMWGQQRNIPPRGGKKIEFRRFAALPKALTPLTEGVTPDGGELTVTTVEAEVKQYGAYIQSSDWLNLTAIDPILTETIRLQGRQAGLTVDTVVRDVMQSGTNVTYCPKIGVAGAETPNTMRSELDDTSVLTVKVLQQVVADLEAANAPKINGYYVGIIHPHAKYDLMQDARWRDWQKYTSPEHMYKNEIGEIAGIRFVESSEAKIFEGGVYGTLVFGADAYGVTKIGNAMETIIKQKGSGGTTDPLDQRSTTGWKANVAAEILIEEYLVRVESKSPVYSKTDVAN